MSVLFLSVSVRTGRDRAEDSHLVDRMRRRVIELQGGRIVRDEATGLYRPSEQSTAEFGAMLRSDDGMPMPRRAPTARRTAADIFDETFGDDEK